MKRPVLLAVESGAATFGFPDVKEAIWDVTTVKPIRGPAVVDDLLREHFRGCRLVLVRGGEGLPRLEADGDGWRLATPGGWAVRRSTAELVADLGRPAFWRRLGRQPGGRAEAAGDD